MLILQLVMLLLQLKLLLVVDKLLLQLLLWRQWNVVGRRRVGCSTRGGRVLRPVCRRVDLLSMLMCR